jgi:leucyl/phenylalanyl-tRNA--protein transferase
VSVFRLDERLLFPPPESADQTGLLAVGGDLRPERLLLAYSLGIFPWYSREPILWYSPDPRFVLRSSALRVSTSLRKTLRKSRYRITLDTAFASVIEACARTRRPGQRGTWITTAMKAAYVELHRRGFAHSAEAWLGERLVGGLYGVSLGGAFFGESMFAQEPDASKAAFVRLVEQLARWRITLIDCQVHTEHLERFGASQWPRSLYLSALRRALHAPSRSGPWCLEAATEMDRGTVAAGAARVLATSPRSRRG